MTGEAALWASIPIPAFIVDAEDRILEANTAAEDFLTASFKSMAGANFSDRVFIDAPLEGAFKRVRDSGAALFVNRVDVGPTHRAPEMCNLKIAPALYHLLAGDHFGHDQTRPKARDDVSERQVGNPGHGG